MKTKLGLLVTFLLFSSCLQANLSAGSAVPNFTLNKLNGGTFSSASLKGKPYVIDFWASWCIPCRVALPALDTIHQEGVTIISISIDKDPQAAQNFLKKYNPSFTVLIDSTGKVASQFGLPTMPTSYLVDKNGKVVKVFAGFKKGDEALIQSQFKQLK